MPKTPAFTGLLDTYPNAAVAYSLRQLRTAYTGAAIRVRRSSDNAEQDINFVSGDLDTQSLLDFVGYNLLNYSEDATQSVWVKTRATVSGDTTTAPDGTLTGDKFIEDLTLGEHGGSRAIGNNITTPGLTYNASCYFKQAERTKIRFYSFTGGGSPYCDVDLTNGTISNSTFTNTPVITTEPNGWYRVSIDVVSVTTSTTTCFSFRTFDALNQISYVGDGASGVYAWGAQFTKGVGVLPYEKTVADAARNGFITTWYDQSTNANNATQATAASQAQIVSSGAVITDPNTSKISTTWTTDGYTISNVSVTQDMLVSGVINRTATLTRLFLLGHTASPPRLVGVSNSGDIISQVGTGSVTHGNITTGAFILSGLRDSSNVVKAWTNTTSLTTGTSTGTTGNFTRFGQQDATTTVGRIVEMVYWNNDKESSRADIVTNQNTYWEVY
jgi:hypothetical protein